MNIKKLTMEDYRKIFLSDNYVEVMERLGFELLPQDDKFKDDYFFYSEELIIFFSAVSSTFYTYPRANKRSV